mmetsp:Transcript_51853/g.105555  ORF Transcript_51853/g.105555 Transcript_51853/m.105555 type:complete len:472 (+) Transcript_51853:1-1416(+)|eukprot:CAMPEP_0181309362 /NCGR_PEP_ID=MMETSP1101-20121128/11972_1 /TAXON_ID=46948 /ORGANISM="Rhodomonas abbreviata, Strain Caron Lab Isolate" /LENGTH=471 /DNA_ID=CAMNT_0023415839 /DNA_START=1 /DNA_END=1416 /DNA_ORIENTATION=-
MSEVGKTLTWEGVPERAPSQGSSLKSIKPMVKSMDVGKFFLSGEDRTLFKQAQNRSMLFLSIFAFLGIMISIVENELRYNALMNLWDIKTWLTTLKAVSVFTSLISVVFLLQYYDARVSLKRACGVYLAPGLCTASLKGSGLWSSFLFDLLILLPQPVPGVDFSVIVWNKGLGRDSVYSVDSVLLSIMFLRVYFLPRFYGECMSEFSSNAAYALSRFNRVSLDQTFIIKHVIAYSLNNVIIVFFLEVAIFAYLMMIFERPTDNNALQHYANCVWLTVITMTTVGYGDLYPTTFLGRLVSVMASITAVIMLAVTINLVISKLSLTRAEEKVIEVMDRISLRKDLKIKATVVIQRWCRAYQKYMKTERNKMLQAKGGYISLTDLKSAQKKNEELRAATFGDQSLLESINDFTEVNAETYHNNTCTDVPELVGNLSSKLAAQVKEIEIVSERANALHAMAARMCAAKGIEVHFQ